MIGEGMEVGKKSEMKGPKGERGVEVRREESSLTGRGGKGRGERS